MDTNLPLDYLFNKPSRAGGTPDNTPDDSFSGPLNSALKGGTLPAEQKSAPSAPIDTSRIEGVANAEGLNAAQTRIMAALLQQESNGGRNAATSIDGARGPGQIMPRTFTRYAKEGESIDNADNNLSVMARIVKDLGTRFGDDPAKVATGYFSGDGNVNQGQGNAWKNDAADGNGKRVSSYVSDVLKRISSAPAEKAPQAPQLPDLAGIPKWGEISQSNRFRGLSADEQQKVKATYFDDNLAPHAAAAGADVKAERAKFLAAGNPGNGLWDQAVSAVTGAYDKLTAPQNPNAINMPGSVMNGYVPKEQAPLPTASRAPVRPEVRAAIQGQWDAATPEQRKTMEQRTDVVGMLARERAGISDAQAVASQDSKTVADTLDTRVEARRARLIAAGEDPRFAEVAARAAAAAGVAPGKEIEFMQQNGGTVMPSTFDFDTNELFKQKGLDNPLARGVAQAGLGLTKSVVGIDEFLSDMVGADEAAKAMRGYGNTLRSKEDALGERGAFWERNLEGAINSIGQQLPLILTGTKLESEAIPLAGIGMQTFGQEYSDGRAKGQSVAQATTRASIFAAFEIIGEKFGLHDQMQAIKAAARGLPSDQIVGFLWSALKKEVPGEMLTTAGQFSTDKFAPGGVGLTPQATGADFLQQMGDTIAQTILQSVLMGAGTTGVSRSIQYARGEGGGEQRLADIRAEQAKERALTAWENAFPKRKAEPTIGTMPQTGSVTLDGRIEPTLGGAMPITPAEPAPVDVHPTSQTADNIVRELAQDHGVPESTVLPTASPVETAGPQQISDQDVLDFAGTRYRMLREKRDGTGTGEEAVPGAGLTARESAEITALIHANGDVQALRTMYGFNQPIPSDQSQQAHQANPQTFEQAPTEQPAVTQTFPLTQEPGLVAAQSQGVPNETGQVQAQEPGPSQRQDAGIATGQPGGPTAQQEPAAQAGGAPGNVGNAVRNAGQQNAPVQAGGAVNQGFDPAGWTKSENTINKKTGQPRFPEGVLRYTKDNADGSTSVVVTRNGEIRQSTTVSPVIEMKNSAFGDEGDVVGGQIHVDNMTGKLIFVVGESGQVIKMSPRAEQQHKDGVPFEKIAETEFSDAGGIRPDGTKTPHTTTAWIQGSNSNGAVSESEADREARLEREAIQSEHIPIEEKPLPHVPLGEDGTGSTANPFEPTKGENHGLQTGEGQEAAQEVSKPKTEKEARALEPQWWKDRTGAERAFVLKASGINGTASTPWNRLTAEQQRALNEQWGPKEQPNGTQAAQAQQEETQGGERQQAPQAAQGVAPKTEREAKAQREQHKSDFSDLEKQLQSKAHPQESAGDVGVVVGGGKIQFVSLDDAVSAARSAIGAGIKPVPFQIHNSTGIRLGDVGRVLAAITPAPKTEKEAQQQRAQSVEENATEKATTEKEARGGASDADTKAIADEFEQAKESETEDGFQMHHLFDAPAKGDVVRLDDRARVYVAKHGWLTLEQAKAKIEEWKQHAAAQGDSSQNSQKVVLSLFDRTGAWSQPWEDAGYQVFRFDIQNDPQAGDINNFSAEFFNDWFGSFDGQDIYAILAACPCTDFASSGARHFGAKDKDGRTRSSVELVQQTLRTIEYFRPAVWAIENPVGRIERLTGLPPWRLAFNPNHLGDPYTKKTLLWGRFNGELPVAPVEPTEGSKMHSQYGGSSIATKNARSVTPEGFSYGFFMANNAIDHPAMAISNKYDRIDPKLIDRAVSAGLTEDQISNAIDDDYYDTNDSAASAALESLIKEEGNATPERKQSEDNQQQHRGTGEDVQANRPDREQQAGGTAPGNESSSGNRVPEGAGEQVQVKPNTVFTEDAAAAARARLKRKLGQVNAGLDPEMMQDGITLAGYHIEKGARTFAAYAKAMIEDLGEAVKPYLKSWYMGVKYDPRAAGFEGMDDAASVDRADVEKAANSDYGTQQGEKNAGIAQPETVPGGGKESTSQAATAGDRNSQSVDAGLAQNGQGTDQDGRVPTGTGTTGTEGTGSTELPGQQPSGAPRNSGSVRPDTGTPNAVDHVISAEDEIGKGGLGQKYKDNVAAIRLLKTLESEGRKATADERKTLSRYVGWGALKGVFDSANKQWQKQYAELKDLLTEDEYRAARESTLDAHYTSPEVVTGMFDALAQLGVTGGRILEPSVGIGNFFGLMPKDMRQNAQLHGVELDSLTSRLVSQLYPTAKIAQATGFQNYEVPGEFFDVVIGNPPFGNQATVDMDRSPYSGFSVHNYFLAKGIDKLRPGGIMAVVVSHNFMDVEKSPARKWIAERANLVSGIRLPRTAFKGNAGTEVVTDILVFQKRGTPEADRMTVLGQNKWADVVKQQNVNPKTGEMVTHTINEYFANPANVAGTPTAAGSMYSANEYTVEPNGDLKKQLTAWADKLPPGIFRSIDRTQDILKVDYAIPDGVKVGSFYVGNDGEVMQRGNDQMGDKTATKWIPKNETAVKRMKGMIELRDTLRAQMRLERDGAASTDDIEANRKKLNDLYDAFQKKFGYLNNQTNRGVFFDDTESQLLFALEFDYDKGIGKATAEKEGIEPHGDSAKKADIFERRVAFPPQDFMNVSSGKDALLASLNYRGKVDLAYMKEIYPGHTDQQIAAELGEVLFEDPQSGMVTSDEYLSGDVKTKLEEAKAAAQSDRKYQRNVDALEKVIPKDKTPSEISATIGAAFIPVDVYQEFVKHITGGDATLAYIRATGQWGVAYHGNVDPALDSGKYGTSDMSARDLFGMLLDGRGAVVKKTYRNPDGSTTTVVLEKETEAAREKQSAIKAEWQKWLWSDTDRADKIASIYNDKMNRIVERKYDGSHMTFPGMNPAITLLEHQKNGVWRGLQDFQVLYDHVVGAGKTFEMATLAMEMRRLGIARKPVFVVPNHLTLQWRSEFTRLYPGSNILAATPEDFSKDRRARLFSKIVTGDWDAVVIGHSSLKKIGLPTETEKAVLQEQIDEITAAIEEMKRARGDKRIVADMEKIRKNLEAKMNDKLAAIGKRDKVLTFDELGIDAMFVDEMHEFKNLTYNSTMDRVPGMGNPAGSAKAFDMFVKVRWLFDTFGERTPFITATGTPVSNSLVEMFNIQRYMQYPTLKADGLNVFDAWAKQFGNVESVYEVAPSGSGYRQSSRFSKFTNLPALMSLYNSFADTITLDDLKAQEEAQGKQFPVPKIEGGRPQNIVAQRSPLVAEFMGVPRAAKDEAGRIKFDVDLSQDIKIEQSKDSGKWNLSVGNYSLGSFDTQEDARLNLVEKALSPTVTVDPKSILGRFANLRELTRETKGKVNALSLTGEANKAGLDFRLINPAAPDFPGSKINLAIDRMVKQYHKWDADKGTQLVFCDMSIPTSARNGFESKERRIYLRDADGTLMMKRGTMHAAEGQEQLPFMIVKRGDKDSKRFDVYDAVSGIFVKGDYRSKQDAKDDMAAILSDPSKRQRWIDKREQAGEIEQSQIDDYNNDNEIDTDASESITREDIGGMSGATKFSVYDDIRHKLIAKGIPEREIAFIHDYATPVQKANLFKAVNAGEVRFLLGSTPKMGAGTNVQERLVGLHHIDAPWRPSDLEQREGRIIRRGNKLYERDPDGFEIFIGRYATEQTYDTRRWQILEHKARGIEQLRNFDGSINEIDDIEGEAANAADMKAAASGDPLILEETQLRNDVKRLENLQTAHADEQLAMVRRAKNLEELAERYLPASIRSTQQILDVVKQNPLNDDGWADLTVDGIRIKDRDGLAKPLAETFLTVQSHLKDKVNVTYRGASFKLENIGAGWVNLSNETGVISTWGPRDSFSPSGFVTRLNNYMDSLAPKIESMKAQIVKNEHDAAGLREQAKAPFGQANELDQAREAHKEIQRKLMSKGPVVPDNQKAEVAAATEAQKRKLRRMGYRESLAELLGEQEKSDANLDFEQSNLDAWQKETGAITPLFDIGRAATAAFAGLPTQRRVNIGAKIDKLNKQVEDGKITDAEFRLAVTQLRQQLKDIADEKKVEEYSKGLRRGPAWVIAQLRRYVADDLIPQGEADFAEWLIKQNPNIAARLAIAFTEGQDSTARGDYLPALQRFRLFTNNINGDAGTAVHEILHHGERMMPANVQEGILTEWQRQWDAAYKAATPEVKAAMRDMLAAAFGNKKATDRVSDAFANGTLNYDDHYQLFSPSEFWAVNATRILSGRYEAKGSWVKQAVQWFKEFIQKIKGAFGLASDAPVIKALNGLLESDGKQQSKNMIQERDYSMWLHEKDAELHADENASPQYNNILRNLQNKAVQFYASQKLDTFNWYDKTIATQYHKAMKDKHFGRVYSLLLAMQNHVAMAATRAAEFGPGVLPRIDDAKAAIKGLVSVKRKEALDFASKAIFSGTLAGENVMQGRVWTEEEFMAVRGATPEAYALYRQARDVIDSMLDEMAAAEAYSIARPTISGNKQIRPTVIDNPQEAQKVIEAEIKKQIKMLEMAAKQAAATGDDQWAAELKASIKSTRNTLLKVEKIFVTAKNLKAAGYAPLKRFGKYEVTASVIDPQTGNVLRDDDGRPKTLWYGRFESAKEARQAEAALRARFDGQDDVRVKAGRYNEDRNDIYRGIDTDALELFAEAIGQKRVADEYIKHVKSDRSAMKHMLERKGIPGFSTDLQRVLAAYVTSGARMSAQQLYSMDVAAAVKYIPSEKGDVQREAQKLRDFVMNQDDPGALLSSVMFLWFLSGSPAAAVVNLTQPGLMSLPYLSQFGGEAKATAELTKALPYATLKKEITDAELRKALHRAGLEGVVDAQEIFHLYNTASRQLASGTNAQSAMTLLGYMFSSVEGFNRRLTFIAAYNMAKQNGEKNPYAFAIRAVNQTQGIYNKVNRPNWARSRVGRAVFTYKTYGIMNLELMRRMWKAGPAGKRAVVVMLALLMLAAGEEGLPGSKAVDDIIDTIGQWLGFDTNMKRWKRRHAYEILGKFWGDLALYGVSSAMPWDIGSRIGLGNVFPGTELLKPSSGINKTVSSLAEIVGPTAGAARQVGDFAEALAEGNTGKAFTNLSPKFVRDLLNGYEMARKGYATNQLGQKTVETDKVDAAVKMFGFNPTTVAEDTREKMPIRQDERLRTWKSSSFAGKLAQAVVDQDQAAIKTVWSDITAWNKANPDTMIDPKSVLNASIERVKKMQMDSDTRTMKTAPKSMRGRVANDIGL